MGTVVENGKDVNVIKNYTYNPENGGTLGKAIFTNEPVYSDWQIIKVSASSHDVRLAGAIFELQSTTDTNVKYYGKSGDAGIVKWLSLIHICISRIISAIRFCCSSI